jgi:Inner membrane component of T3SS, cytoplasmic domain
VELLCPTCGNRQQVGDDAFAGSERIRVTCLSCGTALEVQDPRPRTLRFETTQKSVSPVSEERSVDGTLLRLPADRRISLRVVEGADKGTVYPVAKPRILIGRKNTDVVINDEAVSRVHCTVEVSDEGVLLRDLSSTNGTLVDGQKITTALLANGSRFKIGSHVFELGMTPA